MADIALVLLPGLDGTGVLFRPLISHLSPQIQPIVVSYPRDEPLNYAELLPLVLNALPESIPFILLGESFSGPLAVMAAATHPAGLRGVVLCASFVCNPLWFRPRWVRHFVHPLAFKFFHVLSPVKTLLGGHSTSELRQLLSEALTPVKPNVLACRARAILEVDVRAELEACAVPVLYLQGASDRVVPRRNFVDVQSACPDAQVVKVPSPHLLLQTQPRAASEAIARFFSYLEALP